MRGSATPPVRESAAATLMERSPRRRDLKRAPMIATSNALGRAAWTYRIANSWRGGVEAMILGLWDELFRLARAGA